MKKLLVGILLVLAAVIVWLAARRSSPPEIAFTKVVRQTLISTLTTNGRAEPVSWEALRAAETGMVDAVFVKLGDTVQKGAPVARLDSRALKTALDEAEARVAIAAAELNGLESGGRPSDLAEIENSLRKARLELDTAQREAAALDRLVAKQAATRHELEKAQENVRQWKEAIAGFERKRAALAGPADLEAARSRLREAQAARLRAGASLQNTVLKAPVSGTVYELPVRQGTYLNPGDEVVRIGKLDRLRVTVYVDEPEMGRLAKDMPVSITWDARPGKEWPGVIEALPTQVVALGSRQVGQVICSVGNPEGDLVPGVNINAAIRTAVAKDALVLPKETLSTRGGENGVWLLDQQRVRWRQVSVGISSVTAAEIRSGVSEGDAVALPGEIQLVEGMSVLAGIQ